MADTKAELILNRDTAVELDVLRGTLGQDVADIRTLGLKDTFTFDPGFTPTASCESKITFADSDEDVLLHHGFPIDRLATDSNYLEICYIPLNGEKPTQEQYDELKTMVTRHTMIHEQITRLFHTLHRNSHPMTVMCGITNALAAFYRDSLDVSNPRHREIAVFRLLSKIPTMTTMRCKYSIGQPFVYPCNDLSYAGNFLNMMFSTPCEPYEVNPVLGCTMDRIPILCADREQNAFASTVRTANPSDANPLACIVAGIASLWGPARGGTNEATLKMPEEISFVEHTPEFARRAKDKNDPFRLMDFDHCVHKNYDPCATVMYETCHEVLRELSMKDDLLEVAMGLENIVLNDLYFIEKKLYPNVDFYSGIILRAMDIPFSIFTVVFAMARTVGWIAHWSKMHSDGVEIARPRQLYAGCEKRDFKGDIKRQ